MDETTKSQKSKVEVVADFICIELCGVSRQIVEEADERKLGPYECLSLRYFVVEKLFPSLVSGKLGWIIASLDKLEDICRENDLPMKIGREFCDMLLTIQWSLSVEETRIDTLLEAIPYAIEEGQYYHLHVIILWLAIYDVEACFVPSREWEKRMNLRNREKRRKEDLGLTVLSLSPPPVLGMTRMKKLKGGYFHSIVADHEMTALEYVYRILFTLSFDGYDEALSMYIDMVKLLRENGSKFDKKREDMMERFHREDIGSFLLFVRGMASIHFRTSGLVKFLPNFFLKERNTEDVYMELNLPYVTDMEDRFLHLFFKDIISTKVEFNLEKSRKCEFLVFASDLHVNVMEMMGGRTKMRKTTYFRALERVEKMKSVLLERRIDIKKCGLVILGDLCCFGTRSELMLSKMFFLQCGFGFNYVVPGNHDLSAYFGNYCDSHMMCRHFRKEILGPDCFYTNEISKHKKKDDKEDYHEFYIPGEQRHYFPRVCPLAHNHYLVLMDSNYRGHVKVGFHCANGALSNGQVKRLTEYLQFIVDEAKKDNEKNPNEPKIVPKFLICFHHHTWITTEKLDLNYVQNHVSKLDQGLLPKVLTKFKEYVAGVFHGHVHEVHDVLDKKTQVFHHSIGHLGSHASGKFFFLFFDTTGEKSRWENVEINDCDGFGDIDFQKYCGRVLSVDLMKEEEETLKLMKNVKFRHTKHMKPRRESRISGEIVQVESAKKVQTPVVEFKATFGGLKGMTWVKGKIPKWEIVLGVKDMNQKKYRHRKILIPQFHRNHVMPNFYVANYALRRFLM